MHAFEGFADCLQVSAEACRLAGFSTSCKQLLAVEQQLAEGDHQDKPLSCVYCPPHAYTHTKMGIILSVLEETAIAHEIRPELFVMECHSPQVRLNLSGFRATVLLPCSSIHYLQRPV